jgi:hypothetical protein
VAPAMVQVPWRAVGLVVVVRLALPSVCLAMALDLVAREAMPHLPQLQVAPG